MDRSTVKDLARPHGTPAVSILCPLDARRPGNTHDPRLLAELRDRAAAGVEHLLSGRDAASLITRIDDAVAAVDWKHPSAALAVLVSPDVSHTLALDTTVEPDVVVGEHFALRELVSAMQRAVRARVVVLSRRKSRCVDLTDGDVVERLDDGFPVEVEPPTEADTPHRDFPLDEHEPAEAAKFVFRAVDRVVRAVQQRDPRTLVLVGEGRDLAYFDEVSESGAPVAGRVHGNHEHETPARIAELAVPVLDEHRRTSQAQAASEAREAIGLGAVAGIDDVWPAARDGRGHRLLFEEDYRYPARISDAELQAASDGETGTIDAVDDAIASVLAHDGDALAVPPGSLADVGHLVLLTRY